MAGPWAVRTSAAASERPIRENVLDRAISMPVMLEFLGVFGLGAVPVEICD